MNVLFHTTAAIGVAVMLTDTRAKNNSTKQTVLLSGLAFIVGVASHGALDYIPHCYPINSKFDAIAGLTVIIALTILSNKKYRPIVGLAFIGSIFPDLIDLSPQIINKYLGLNFPISQKLFPWHWEKYSGSIFINDCNVSTVNHLILILVVTVICWLRKTDIKNILTKTNEKNTSP